jgi:hypothetical protein
MSPFGKDETGHASPVGTILPFTLHVTGSIPHGDIVRPGYKPSAALAVSTFDSEANPPVVLSA